MWIVDVRAKIWDFSNVRTQKWVRPKCPWNVISLLFMYFNLVKFSKNLQNFLKRRLRRRFGRFAPENPETLQSKPPLGPKSCNRNPPPRGVRDPIISSAWTPRRARTGSYASLIARLSGAKRPKTALKAPLWKNLCCFLKKLFLKNTIKFLRRISVRGF